MIKKNKISNKTKMKSLKKYDKEHENTNPYDVVIEKTNFF